MGPAMQAAIEESKPGHCIICDKPITRGKKFLCGSPSCIQERRRLYDSDRCPGPKIRQITDKALITDKVKQNRQFLLVTLDCGHEKKIAAGNAQKQSYCWECVIPKLRLITDKALITNKVNRTRQFLLVTLDCGHEKKIQKDNSQKFCYCQECATSVAA